MVPTVEDEVMVVGKGLILAQVEDKVITLA